MPRDVGRIEKTLDYIRTAWYMYPDLRLMQLLDNALGPGDKYNVEDEEVVRRVAKWMEEVKEE